MALAAETGALSGRVEDEWSLEQIRAELRDPRSGDTRRRREPGRSG
ncbi:hypothetical protein [Amycolatopsis sp. CA-128772]|nr:hypothetical protein [Amycolatopsis sp. CA-128772]